MVLYLLCALFNQEQLHMFRTDISDKVHKFADGTPVDTVYGNIPTPVLFFLWQSVLTSCTCIDDEKTIELILKQRMFRTIQDVKNVTEH